jgi:hypothetical protein
VGEDRARRDEADARGAVVDRQLELHRFREDAPVAREVGERVAKGARGQPEIGDDVGIAHVHPLGEVDAVAVVGEFARRNVE